MWSAGKVELRTRIEPRPAVAVDRSVAVDGDKTDAGSAANVDVVAARGLVHKSKFRVPSMWSRDPIAYADAVLNGSISAEGLAGDFSASKLRIEGAPQKARGV